MLKNGCYKTIVADIVSEKATPDEDGIYRLTAKYEIDGITYYSTVNTLWNRDKQINMYYVKNPKYAVDNVMKLGSLEGTRKIFTVVSVIIFICITLFWKLS